MSSTISRLSRSRAVLAAVVAIVSAGVASVVTAAASDDPNVIHGCVSNRNGTLRVVQSTTDCTSKETAISWNKEGQPGPKGDTGISPAAGTSCPTGQFVTGIAIDGTLVCAAPSADGGGGGGGGTDPIDCNDGNAATIDTYDPASGTCTHELDSTFDGDGDGYTVTTDCNDADAAINPGAIESPGDGKDNNCDGVVDEASDVDNDGFAAPEDCNDGDSTVYPGSPHEVVGDGKDSNCDGHDGRDGDQDGWSLPQDCDDTDPGTNPDAVEVADGRDNDCDGIVDEMPE